MIATSVLAAVASARIAAELAAIGNLLAIGTVKRAVLNAPATGPTTPPAPVDAGSVDAAVVALNGIRALPSTLFEVLDASSHEENSSPVQTSGGRVDLPGDVMTNAELDNLLASSATDPEGLKVFKSGAATGLTRGLIRSLAPVTALSVGGAILYFLNQVVIAPDPAASTAGGAIVAAGDSGALWIHARTRKIVALQHATMDGLAVASRISDITKALNIRFA
jgi:hypothetical protein